MFRWKRERIPEGGAIDDEEGLSAERYGEIMLRRLGKEYRRFARYVADSSRPVVASRQIVAPRPEGTRKDRKSVV